LDHLHKLITIITAHDYSIYGVINTLIKPNSYAKWKLIYKGYNATIQT